MYRVLLVDDEVLIREAIAENIDWNGLGFELCGVCENGKEAIEKIKENPPDLVLTDICMPYVDGLDLAKYIYENYETVKVVIISGYDNFEYAKGAILYQVMEYILKPVTAFELSETLLKVRERLDSERQESRQLDRIKEAYKKSMPLLRERFLNQLLLGRERCDSVEDALIGYDIRLKGETYAVIQIVCTSSFDFVNQQEEAEELVRFAAYNVAEEMVKTEPNCTVFQESSNITTFLMAGESEYHLERRVDVLCSNIQTYLVAQLRIHTMAVMGRCVERLKELYKSYENLTLAREYGFLFEDESIIYGREFYHQKETSPVDIHRWSERINLAVRQGNEEQLLSDVKAFFQTMRKNHTVKERLVAYIHNIVLKVMEVLEEVHPEAQEAQQMERTLFEYLGEDHKMEYMESAVAQFCSKVSKILVTGRENMGQIQAAKALDYIEKNYQDMNVSLNSVCRYLAMSTSYFSVVFKSQTGETFTSALTKKRIEKAKELLETTDLKTYEVAEEVGYSDAHYFGSTFKKYTGETPKEYARKRR